MFFDDSRKPIKSIQFLFALGELRVELLNRLLKLFIRCLSGHALPLLQIVQARRNMNAHEVHITLIIIPENGENMGC